MQKALDCLNEALPIEQKANSVLGQAMTFNTMGRVYTDMGQEDKALSYLNQALPLWQTLGQRTGEADALTYIGRVYNNLGQREEALKNLNDAMEIWHDIDNPDTSMAAQAAPPSQPSGRLAKKNRSRETEIRLGKLPSPTPVPLARRERSTVSADLLRRRPGL